VSEALLKRVERTKAERADGSRRRASPGLLCHLACLVAIQDGNLSLKACGQLGASRGQPAHGFGHRQHAGTAPPQGLRKRLAKLLPSVGARVRDEIHASGRVIRREGFAPLPGGNKRLTQVVHVDERELLAPEAGLEEEPVPGHGQQRWEIDLVPGPIDERGT